MPREALAYVALGSNLGDRQRNLDGAVEWMARLPGTEVVAASRWLETAPVGGPPQGAFLNGVVALRTLLEPRPLLTALLSIERRFGRERGVRWGPRTLDLDLLAHGDAILDEPGLQVPHPRMRGRSFVLAPLVELNPGWIHPEDGVTAAALLERLGD
ncbi:MAG: 2-amino-4-hydroxy-6-hydroxymethyldihydropteridine diphosphokinase [Myxococcales bacterium]|nr:2-amino-4-hydroxy-6-hydroxymethyldihydropteridine diphosphokinase [Myxococcales bacterium]